MARKTKKELEKIKKKYNVSTLWSWSKYNTAKRDLYEYYLKYIKRAKEDRLDGIYAPSGGVIHDAIEDFYNGKLDHEGMLQKYENALFDFDLAGLKYDRCDDEKNEKIAKKYEYCIRHFCKNHIELPYKLYLEQFITIKIGNYAFQGYIDALHKEERDGKTKYIITDWKSSSLYRGKKIDKEKGQLVLYAEGVRQKGVPLEDIIIRWCFLKYVDVEHEQANGKINSRTISRHEIGKKLKSTVKMWLKKCGYNEKDVDKYLKQIVEENSIDCLPDDVREKFKIKDCYVEIPLNEKVVDELKEDIIKTIKNIKVREVKYEKTRDEKLFWQEVTDQHSYFLANLCGYSRKIHKPYNEYLKALDMFKDEENDDEEDLSWLDNL